MQTLRLPALASQALVLAISIAAWLALAAGQVAADAGPHMATINSGSSTLTADTCAACHRAHSAQGEFLISAATETALCLACHGSAALGAVTNVEDGVLAGPTSQGLKSGGFANALMDTSWTGGAALRPATSAHLIDGTTLATMWGAGAIGSGAGTTGITMNCVSCHNPHGNGSYRILRPIPIGSPATAGVAVVDEPVKRYVVQSPQNRYFGEKYGLVEYDWQWRYQLEQWCAACHTRYDALNSSWDGVTGAPGHTPSGDPIFTYRHMTRYDFWINCNLCHPGSNGINADDPFNVGYETAHEADCANCHVAHGSAATMGVFSGSVAWPDGSTSPSGSARSSLLRLDNRGVCVGCHNPWR